MGILRSRYFVIHLTEFYYQLHYFSQSRHRWRWIFYGAICFCVLALALPDWVRYIQWHWQTTSFKHKQEKCVLQVPQHCKQTQSVYNVKSIALSLSNRKGYLNLNWFFMSKLVFHRYFKAWNKVQVPLRATNVEDWTKGDVVINSRASRLFDVGTSRSGLHNRILSN